MANKNHIKAKNAISWLNKTNCLDKLLQGKSVKANDHTHIGGARGLNIAKQVRDNVNDILTQYSGGLTRVNATEIDFNSSQVKVKPEYQEQFVQAVLTYGMAQHEESKK